MIEADYVTTDPDVLEAYRSDRAGFVVAGRPAALARPRSTAEVARVLEFAHEHRIPVVPQGARTGMSGGATAVEGAILLSLERMDRILAIDELNHTATVEPGVINAVLSAAVAEKGLFYPPDPGSWQISTIGGNVATNAGGLCCVKYGVTSDFVRELEVVLADGRILRTGRRTAKGVAGYDLVRLFTGSEGTLGVVTEVTVALRSAAERPLTALAFFATPAAACGVVGDYLSSGRRPSVLEFMDSATVDAVSAYRDLGFPDDVGAVLIAQSDRGPAAHDDLDAFAKVAREHGATEVFVATDQAEADLLIEARRLVGDAVGELGDQLVDDVCVPRSRLAELVEGIAAIGHEHGVRIPCCGHAGDGNMHPTVVFDAADPDSVRRGQAAFDAIMQLGLRLGGTITGEHGIGTLKQPWLETELGEVGLSVHQAVKQAFDPRGILNPGKVLRRPPC
ncbi:FAD-binding protein [Amycolatopsis acidiphila]|uniref:FAD-binding protein n=1 Tax=Amycolatopsis acidiphila TaxID=715473 RepID=A0A558AHF5_9PSEU|nr:FAD-linked oxidase C-terminal domain-containing protein [Amycolatopsis acidiphila]TVT23696.1 FAD-binding protein [Amycolatopsis acidiphila]UIJ58688.1 FAD-binding protein [Amycolatopsis acidiphila]GHG76022.1 FAD-linked oxidase [Amycolatopsis acidiphila]